MDTRLPCEFLATVIVILAGLIFESAVCQVYSWSVPVPLNTTKCSGSTPLTLDWTYAPSSPDPLAIEWSKQSTSGTPNNIASYDGVAFEPSDAYNGSVSRTGSTAEIAIQRPLTTADGGVYRVTVIDGGGLQINAEANVIIPDVTKPIIASCQENAAGGFTVSCSVQVSPPVTLQLRNSTDIIDSGSSANVLDKTISNAANLTFQCSVTGDGSECITPNTADVTCVPDISTSTPGGPTTSTPNHEGICKDNDLCYLFILPVLVILIGGIGLIVWCCCVKKVWCCCVKKKKAKKSDQENSNMMAEIPTDKSDKPVRL